MRCSRGRSRPAPEKSTPSRKTTDGGWAAWSTRSAIIGKSAARWRRRMRRMPGLGAVVTVIALAGAAAPPHRVSFATEDGGRVYADLYGTGGRGVVLAHGGRFTKESWEKRARGLAAPGRRTRTIACGARGQSRGPASKPPADGVEYDVLAAVRYLRASGARTVSIVGASFGGAAAAQAAVLARPGEIDRLVLLAHGEIPEPERMQGRKLFVVARDDANDAGPRLPRIRRQYERAPGPKELLILEGSAHAQFIFETDQGERLMREIVRGTVRVSKAIAQRELDHARAAVGDHLPQRRIGLESGGVEARRAVERAELGAVREVVELGAELQPVILVQSKHLRQRDVPLVDAGLAHDVLGCVAVIDVPGKGHAELRRAGPADDGRVEP